MKKLVLVLLTLSLILLPILASCGGDEPDKKKENVTTEGSQYLDELPDNLNFNNEAIDFITAEHFAQYAERSIGLENYVLGNGNSVDDAIFKRNQKIEERLQVVITNTMTGNSAISQAAVYNDLQSGTADYDVISAVQAFDLPMTLKGLVLELNDLATYDADYLDLSADYWSQAYIKNGSYKGLTFWVTGDLALRYLSGMYCTFVNTELYTNALEKDNGSIYSLVNNKQWTMDKMIEMSQTVYDDRGISGKVDQEDIVGVSCNLYAPITGFFIGAGLHYSVNDAGGNPSVAITTDNEDLISFFSKMNNLFYKSGSSIMVDKDCINLFAKGNALFCLEMIGNAEMNLSEMENFGIIPPPMLDSEQDNYASLINAGCSLYGIYSGSSNIPATAATLEALAAMSLQTVTPEYYDLALKYRYTRDEDSAGMVDLIRSVAYCDFGVIWRGQLDDAANLIEFMNSAVKTNSFSGTLKGNQSAWEAALDTLLEKFENYALHGSFGSED